MRNFLSVLGLFVSVVAFGQNSEFKIHSNGLIYSEHTMTHLSQVVDSLNYEFKTCNFNTRFHSVCQAFGHFITIPTKDLNEVQADMANKISLDDLITKYPTVEIERDILILKYFDKDYFGRDIIKFEEFGVGPYSKLIVTTHDIEKYQDDHRGTWLLQKSTYGEPQYTFGFYFEEDFISETLPQEYSETIGYADCLIKPMEPKIHDNATYDWDQWLPTEPWQNYSKEEKTDLLEKLRCMKVVGTCSQDSSPRKHAINIAILAAETHNWDVFLKAHLDILNDSFDRATDGSYAWEQRKTYIKELEALNIQVSDLLLGIAFRIQNPVENHYFGNVGRMGRALSETKYIKDIETDMLSVISNDKVDYFNRLVFYHLFRSYNHYLDDEDAKQTNQNRLITALEGFPEGLQNRIIADL